MSDYNLQLWLTGTRTLLYALCKGVNLMCLDLSVQPTKEGTNSSPWYRYLTSHSWTVIIHLYLMGH